MERNRICVSLALALLVLALTSPMLAQSINDVYQVGYFNNNDGLAVRIINTGQIGSPIDAASGHGTVCADIYVFDANQEMLACCSCPLTANELTELRSVQTLTRVEPPTGVIKIVSDRGCDATNITAPVPAGLRAFQVNPQRGGLTETLYQPAPLTVTEQNFLGQTCSFVLYLGSGVGTCRCAPPRPPLPA